MYQLDMFLPALNLFYIFVLVKRELVKIVMLCVYVSACMRLRVRACVSECVYVLALIRAWAFSHIWEGIC